MKRRKELLFISIILLVGQSLWAFPGFHAPRHRQYYDSLFNAYHYRSRFGTNDSLSADIRYMLDKAERDGNTYAKMLAMMDLSIDMGIRGQTDTMFAMMERAHRLQDRNTPFTVRAYAYYSDGIVFYIARQYARSIDQLEQAKTAYEQLNDTFMIAKTLVNMSNIFTDQLMYLKAENLLNEALTYTHGDMRAMTLLHMAGLKMKMSHEKQAAEILSESRYLMEKANNRLEDINYYTSNYWRYYHHLRYFYHQLSGNLDSAKIEVAQLMEVAERFCDDKTKTNATLLRAEIHVAEGEYKEAIAICQDVCQNYHGPSRDQMLYSAYKIMTPCLVKLGLYKEAYEAEKCINDLTANSKILSAKDIQSIEMFNHYEMRILEMENQQRERMVRSTAVASTAIIAALIGFFIIIIRWMTRKSTPARPKTTLAALKAVTEEEGELLTESERLWRSFEGHFRATDPDFEERISAEFKELTSTEIKIAMAIRKGVVDEETQQMLTLSTSSMKVYRSRIKKKLHLAASNETLDEFLAKY